MKFSIIMPTYNDAETILESVESIVNQDYKNWELIISIDGSTDGTEKVVKEYLKKNKENRIFYYTQDNQDQLNAILNVCKYISGDYVYILHSDDVFYDNKTLSKVNRFLTNNKKFDSIIADIYTINENMEVIGKQVVKNYFISDENIVRQLLWLGRNQYVDVAFHKKNTFLTKVKENYLTWNTPFWLDLSKKPKMLNVKKVDFPFLKYRVFEGNYINNEIGKLNVINGELRCAIKLLKYYEIPFYRFQYNIFRILNKFNIEYKPLYKNNQTKNKYKIVSFIIKKRYKLDEIKKYPYLNSLLSFFKNINNNNNNEIKIIDIPDDCVFYGADIRLFNNKMLKKDLPSFYYSLFENMEKGFSIVSVQQKDYKKLVIILKFLCIYDYVKIKINTE